MKRLTYNYNPTLDWHETAPILCGHGSIIGAYRGLTYYLMSYESGTKILEKKAKSSASLKRNLKKELIAHGAIFEDEIRGSKCD